LRGEDRVAEEACYLARKLMAGYTVYFSRGVLNSEGRKVFEELARRALKADPSRKSMVKRARRNPTLENVTRVCEEFLGLRCLDLVRSSIEGPYRYRLPDQRGEEEQEYEEEGGHHGEQYA